VPQVRVTVPFEALVIVKKFPDTDCAAIVNVDTSP